VEILARTRRTRSGATFDGSGTNFALFSEVADRVELCLFEVGPGRGATNETRVELTEVDATSGTATCPASSRASVTATACTVRGTRAGPAVQPNKLLLDPYAKATAGDDRLGPVAVRLRLRRPDSRNDDDSAAAHDHGVVINPFFDWEGDRRSRSPTTSRSSTRPT
jgi:glycogen operon protein